MDFNKTRFLSYSRSKWHTESCHFGCVLLSQASLGWEILDKWQAVPHYKSTSQCFIQSDRAMWDRMNSSTTTFMKGHILSHIPDRFWERPSTVPYGLQYLPTASSWSGMCTCGRLGRTADCVVHVEQQSGFSTCHGVFSSHNLLTIHFRHCEGRMFSRTTLSLWGKFLKESKLTWLFGCWRLLDTSAVVVFNQEDDVKKSKVDLGEMLHLAVSSSCPE